MSRATLLLLLVACGTIQPVEGEEPCLEAGYAIAYVTELCTGDVERANARFERFDAGWRCLPRRFDDPELAAAGVALQDLYGCGFAIRQLPCETVADYGDDIGAYLDVTEACSWVAEPRGGGR